MKISWKELARQINQMSDEQQETDVTVMVADEFHQVEKLEINKETDILDIDHPFLSVSTIKENL